MATQRQKRKGRMSARDQANREKGGFSFTSIRVPEGAELFDPGGAGVKRFEIVPYTAGEGNPNAEPGELHYERTFWIHRNIGANEDSYVCPNKTAGLPCYVCEALADMRRTGGDKDVMDELAPRKRQLWNIFDHGERDKGVQPWEVSYHLFGKQLFARVRDSDEEDGYEYFADPEDGMTLKVGFAEESAGSYKFLQASTIDFKPRGALPKKVLAAAHNLDEMPVLLPYEELKAIFLQEPGAAGGDDDDDGDGADEPPKTSRRSKPAKGKGKGKTSKPAKAADSDSGPAADIAVGDTVTHDEYGECTVLKVSRDGATVTIEDAEEDYHKVSPSDLTVAGGDADRAAVSDPDEDDDAPFDDGDSGPAANASDADDDWDDWGDD